jgi:hypothetical protein
MPTPRLKRPYSQEFRPHHSGHSRYLLDRIPGPLWKAARAKARQEHVSMRAQLLRLLQQWVASPEGPR